MGQTHDFDSVHREDALTSVLTQARVSAGAVDFLAPRGIPAAGREHMFLIDIDGVMWCDEFCPADAPHREGGPS